MQAESTIPLDDWVTLTVAGTGTGGTGVQGVQGGTSRNSLGAPGPPVPCTPLDPHSKVQRVQGTGGPGRGPEGPGGPRGSREGPGGVQRVQGVPAREGSRVQACTPLLGVYVPQSVFYPSLHLYSPGLYHGNRAGSGRRAAHRSKAVAISRINERPGIQTVVHSLGANLPSTVDGRPLGIAESGTGLPIFQHWTKSWRCCSLLGVVAA